MDNKYAVYIKMVSVGEDETTVQLAEGTLYERPEGWFLRYEEPGLEQGKVNATIKITDKQIKLMRRGGVDSDMTFEAGVFHEGYFTTPLIHMILETLTSEFLVELHEGIGKLIWSYKLMNQDVHSSNHRVTVWISQTPFTD